jgi:xylulokinase
VILTLDFGTSVTKAVLWADDGLVARAGISVDTTYGPGGRAEQDPAQWWSSLVRACSALREAQPRAFGEVDVVGCTGARQTVVLVDNGGHGLGPAMVWSDRRAGMEAARVRRRLETAGRSLPRSGIEVDAASVAAKLTWLEVHEAERLAAAAWLLTPRDHMVWAMTGVVATDPTMAWRSGLYDPEGGTIPELVGDNGGLLAPLVAADRVTGVLTRGAGAALGMAPGTPVVIGCGDRASEVLGSGATATRPMVSWGTTANVSVPVGHRAETGTALPGAPSGVILARSADGGWLFEGGLSAAGTLLAWLGTVTGHSAESLAALAATSPPGGRGVVAAPWLEGARAPWWRDDATAAIVGLGPTHTVADLARAAFESVAWDVLRCLEAMGLPPQPSPTPMSLVSTGGGSGVPVWIDVLSAVTGRAVETRRSGEAASAGAALLAARAVGMELDLDDLDPVAACTRPDGAAASTYRALRQHVDCVATAVLDLGSGPDVGGESCT